MRHNLRDRIGRYRCAPPRSWIRFWLVDEGPSIQTFRLARQMLAGGRVIDEPHLADEFILVPPE